MIEIEEYVSDGRSPFADWLDRLDAATAARITTVLHRLELGNPGDVAPVGAGVSERRVDYGPGYRIYLGSDRKRHSPRLILLCGGTKLEQRRDILKAKQRWKDYRNRQRKEF